MKAAAQFLMITFISFLEELADTERTVIIPGEEVERLVDRFGDRVRQMGRWNASGDASLEIPVSVIREAASPFGRGPLIEAVQEFKDGHLSKMLETSSAASLIENICEAYRRYFRGMVTRYQNTGDPAESIRLRDQLVREVFGE